MKQNAQQQRDWVAQQTREKNQMKQMEKDEDM